MPYSMQGYMQHDIIMSHHCFLSKYMSSLLTLTTYLSQTVLQKEQHKHRSGGPTKSEVWLPTLSDNRDYHAFALQQTLDRKKTEQREALNKLL